MDKISIITANYNRSALLEKAILSIANQKSTNFFTREMIIVDDGSTDNSIDVINKYSKKYPQNIRLFSQKNWWANKARNVWLDNLAKDSTYVIFLDNDDEITSWTFDFYLKTREALKKSGEYEKVFSINAFCEDENWVLVWDKKILMWQELPKLDYRRYLQDFFVIKEMTAIDKSCLYIENKEFRFDEKQLIWEAILWLSIHKYCFQKWWYTLIANHSARVFRLVHGARTSTNVSSFRFQNSAETNIKILEIAGDDLLKFWFKEVYAEFLLRIWTNYILASIWSWYSQASLKKKGMWYIKKALAYQHSMKTITIYVLSFCFPPLLLWLFRMYAKKN